MTGEALTDAKDAAEFLGRFEVLHSIRSETTKLSESTSNLEELLAKLSSEKESLSEFKTEMSLLLNEKLKHVEILRQIHSDINMMEAVMKQSQDEHTVTLNSVRSIFKEFETVRATVNDLRHETHLPVLTDPVLEYIDIEAPKLIGTHSKPQRSKQILLAKSQPKPEKPAFPMAPAPAKRSRSSAEAHPPNMPPMKQCSTCHQHIHRNAPICPLCKAKLRSRNPKKPRK